MPDANDATWATTSTSRYAVIPTDDYRQSIQIRTHKKKRINKKWLKRYGVISCYDWVKHDFTEGGLLLVDNGVIL